MVPEAAEIAVLPQLHVPPHSRLRNASWPGRRAAVFLDRDGVLIADTHYVRDPAQVRVLPRVTEALQVLEEQFCLIVVTNQSGLARGFFDERDLLAIHAEMMRQLAAGGARIDAVYYCPHLSDGHVVQYRKDCDCRKPRPGLILRALEDWDIPAQASFMVGDALRDVEAGKAAGVQGILIGGPVTGCPEDVEYVPDLLAAARLIFSRARGL